MGVSHYKPQGCVEQYLYNQAWWGTDGDWWYLQASLHDESLEKVLEAVGFKPSLRQR